MIQDMTEKIILIKQRIQAARDRQKSYDDRKRKPMEFEVEDLVMLKVLAKVRDVAYRLELPQELSRVHHTFHVSNLKKCYADEPLTMPLEGVHIDDTLQFAGTPGGVLSSPRNVKIRSNKNTHISSQTGPRHPLQGGVLSLPGNAKIRSNKNTHISSQTGPRHPLQGPSTPPSDSLGPSRNAECSNCKFLL
uniref:Tf2-1-like SH3-like domain-containing protein n=1 Tax=Tanacetum cinerariifolium TaxID=118510 RepID=A0A6L2JZ73_TANCI|nr:hypothetical protein [Tanacetum cinerariifolium]